jgi:hypothetical protein
MKIIVEIDPLLVVLLDDEANKYGSSRVSLVRASIIDWLTRTYSTQAPSIFADEKEIIRLRNIFEKYQKLLSELSEVAPFLLPDSHNPLEYFEAINNFLFMQSKKERHTLFMKSKTQI